MTRAIDRLAWSLLAATLLGSCQLPDARDTVSLDAAGIDKVVVDTDLGRVEVRRGEALSLERVGVWSPGVERSQRRVVDGSGERLELLSRCGGAWTCRADSVLTVPPGVAVEVLVGEGEVTLYDLDVPVTVTVGAGTVRAEGLSSAEASVAVGKGRVDLDLAKNPRRLTVAVADGDVRVRAGHEPVRLVTEVGGEVSGDVADDPEAGRELRVTVANGDVVVTRS